MRRIVHFPVVVLYASADVLTSAGVRCDNFRSSRSCIDGDEISVAPGEYEFFFIAGFQRIKDLFSRKQIKTVLNSVK